MAFNRLNVIIGAKLEGFEKSIKQMERSLAGFSRNMQRIGDNLTKSVTLPVAGLGIAAAKSFAETEKLQMALTAVMKDSGLAAAEMEKLRKVAQAPGLAFDQAVKASARLQAVGLNADQAREVITQFGNAVARSGGGATELDGAVLALTQIASKGKISAEEINQLNERIFEVRPALEKAFGTSNSEELQKLGISSEEFIAKVTQEFSKLERVNGGLANSFENFKDSAQTSLSTLGAEINKVFNLQDAIDGLAKKLAMAVEWFKGLDDSTKKTILTVAGIAAAIGPALLIIGKLSSVAELALKGLKNLYGGVRLLISGIGLLFSPIGLAIGALAAIAAGVVIAYNKFEGFRRGVNAVINVISELAMIAKEAFAALIKGFGQLKSGDLSGAAKSFGEAIVKGNPIGIALTQGKRLGEAFREGFADDSNLLQEQLDKLKNKFKSTTQGISKSVNDILGGGNVFADSFTRSGGGGSSGGSGASTVAQPGRSASIANFASLQTIQPATEIKALSNEVGVLDKSLQSLGAKVEITNSGMTAGAEQILAWKDAVTGLGLEINTLSGLAIPSLNSALNAGINTFSQLAEQGITSFRQLAKAVVAAGAEIIKVLVQQGVAAAIANTLRTTTKLLGPVGIALASAAGVAASGLFKSLLGKVGKFADGGIAYGPTLGLFGEYAGASRNPEVVAPLDKLKSMIGGAGGGVIIPDVRIAGTDIVISFTRAAAQMNRSGDLGQLKAIFTNG